MATWAETQQHLRDKFKLVVDQPDWLGLGWKFGDVIQKQRVERVQSTNDELVLVWCDVAPEDKIPHRDALLHNMTLAVGSLALFQDTYVIRHLYSLAELSFATLDKSLELIAHEAARLRAHALQVATSSTPSPNEGGYAD
jgi:hypothetical protein